jgi:3-oxoacyl-[acyl-carrier protein] reductase
MSGEAVAIVTGGSRGIGREIARRLADEGYAVVVVYLQHQGEAEAAVAEILATEGTALAVRADVTDELDVERLFDETEAAFGGVDLVVDTATPASSVVNRHAARHLRHGGSLVTAGERHHRQQPGTGVPTRDSPGATGQWRRDAAAGNRPSGGQG